MRIRSAEPTGNNGPSSGHRFSVRSSKSELRRGSGTIGSDQIDAIPRSSSHGDGDDVEESIGERTKRVRAHARGVRNAGRGHNTCLNDCRLVVQERSALNNGVDEVAQAALLARKFRENLIRRSAAGWVGCSRVKAVGRTSCHRGDASKPQAPGMEDVSWNHLHPACVDTRRSYTLVPVKIWIDPNLYVSRVQLGGQIVGVGFEDG